jgi:hypothetical protein
MPVSWRIEPPCVLLESLGAPTLEEWKAAIDAALTNPACAPGATVVHDLRRMTRIPDAEEAKSRVAFLAARSRRAGISRWAIVVEGSAHYGMGRMAQILADFEPRIRLRVFRELADAKAWARGEDEQRGGAA